MPYRLHFHLELVSEMINLKQYEEIQSAKQVYWEDKFRNILYRSSQSLQFIEN